MTDEPVYDLSDFDFYADAIGVWWEWQTPRICRVCERAVWPEQPDPCLGWLPDVHAACCGHGERSGGFPQGYIAFNNGPTIRFDGCLVDGVHLVDDVDEDGCRVLRRVF